MTPAAPISNEASAASAPATDRPVLSVRIVVVDDHELLRDGLALRLSREPDFEVVGKAASSPEASACVSETSPDLVIMDLHLPGENGLVATSRIRQANPATKILVLTGDPRAGAAHEALLAGASGFLGKTDGGDNVVRAVRTVMSGKIYLSTDAATTVAQALVARPAADREPALSDRELTVLRGMADGLGYKEIADELGVSVKSIEAYRARLVRKTACATRAELVRYAIRHGIISA